MIQVLFLSRFEDLSASPLHRQTRYGKSYWDKGSKYYQVANNQNWQCPVCSESLFNGEQLHTHHLLEIQNGGTNEVHNLIHLHQACHHHVHNGKNLSGRKLERLDGKLSRAVLRGGGYGDICPLTRQDTVGESNQSKLQA